MSEPVRSTPPSTSSGTASDVARVQQLAQARDEIVARLRQRIVGQEEVIELLLIALFARGHGLFVGVPGLAKTLLKRRLQMRCRFIRIASSSHRT